MKKSLIAPITVCFLSLCVRVSAAPAPGMGSSRLSSLESGVAFLSHGFRMPVKSNSWNLQAPSDTHGLGVGSLIFDHQHLANSMMSLRLESVKKARPLEANARRWVKDYLHYGFDLLGTKTFQEKGQRGFVADLFHREKMKQVRQIVYQHDNQLAIFTLSSSNADFDKALADFNSVVRNFQWSNDPPKTIKTF